MKLRQLTTVLFILASISFLTACSKEKPVWIKAWKETAPLTTKRAGAATVVSSGHIYVMGGVDGRNFLRTTEYAKINGDGSLSPWKAGPLMNEERGFTDAIVHKGYIYIVGGGKGPYGKILLRTVEKARILPEGGLGPWETEKYSMNMPRRCSKIVLSGSRISTFGGFGGDMLNTVEHADLLDNGTTDEWFEEEEKLTAYRYISGVKNVGDTTYVVGGHHQTEGVGITDVEWSRIVDESGYQPWKKTTPLQTGRYGPALTGYKNYLYALGGITGADYLDSVEMSESLSDGNLTPWRFSTPLSSPRSMPSAVVYKDFIYILGGTNNAAYLKKVEYARLNEKGEPGYFGSEKDKRASAERAKEKEKKAKAPLPNEGVVLKTMQTKQYTYILVSFDGKGGWLAAPKMELKKGTTIRYGKGVFMTNFYSKELKIDFPAVIFVGKIQRVDK